MAKTTRVMLTCDLHGDGTEAVTTIRMDNGTARYELDLCQSHFDELTGAGMRLRPRRRTGGARGEDSAPWPRRAGHGGSVTRPGAKAGQKWTVARGSIVGRR